MKIPSKIMKFPSKILLDKYNPLCYNVREEQPQERRGRTALALVWLFLGFKPFGSCEFIRTAFLYP
ncbi:MAG: hypothetical protein E7605_04025 [Ruminococcaceae bacterium]|nr:hypothetical protein [Oscillospiraceae bacterium]